MRRCFFAVQGGWRSAFVLIVLGALLVGLEARAADPELDLAIGQAKRLVVPSGTIVLAAHVSSEGHWSFVNGQGERFTAASPDEMKRVSAVLAPSLTQGTTQGATKGASDANAGLVLIIAASSVFRHAQALAALPRDARLRLSTVTGVYEMIGDKPRLIQINPSLRVELGEQAAFDEILQQLDTSVARGGIRVLALEPGGPATLAPRPPLELKAKSDLIERIEPLRLKDAINDLAGQTVLITGRLDEKFLHFQVSGGPERRLIIADLTAAAAANDVNLVILDAPAGRQPGARNWLWLRAEVDGVAILGPDPGIDGLLASLATPTRPLNVRLVSADARRVALIAAPGGQGGQSASGLGTTLSRVASDIASNVTGRIEPIGIHLHLISATRQRELDRRLLRWLPAWGTFGYLLALVVGAAGAAVSWRWWQKIWPPEMAQDYPVRAGLVAARVMRGIVFVLIFMPLVSIVSAPITAVNIARRGLTKPRLSKPKISS